MGSWADEVASPTIEATKSLADAQVDGAVEPQNGSQLTEPMGEFEVAVKLSDLQADPNDPLYSVKTFEQLGL
jgi:ATP-dependent RNA helicase DDX19/DBP5